LSLVLPHGWIEPQWPVAPRVRAVSTTRAGGFSHGAYASLNLATRVGDDPSAVERNREVLRSVLRLDPLWLHQVHGTDVVEADSAPPLVHADAAVSRTRHHACAVLTADCLPLLLADRDGTVVAVAHAGWRGLAGVAGGKNGGRAGGGIIEATVARIGVPGSRLVAWLGPAIGAAAYEVGEDVYRAFIAGDAGAAAAFQPGRPGKFHADLCALARRRLQSVGVTAIHGGGYCTYSDPERFFSYRRDGQTGRMATVIWID
jgi:YfiH family protein